MYYYFTMKYLYLTILLALANVAIWAQDVDRQERDVAVQVLNKKGRPVKSIIVHSSKSTKAGVTDKKGLYVFSNMTDDDKVTLFLPRIGETVIPVTGLDSVVVVLISARQYSYRDYEGTNIMIKKDNAKDNVILDVPMLLSQCSSCNSLADLLRGRVAGLNIGGSSTSIRGPSSFVTNNEPLVVLDGVPFGTINDANAMINIHSIKTIEILKSATEWGMRGSNGVIVIKSQ